jgi:hypothetical protein
MDKMLRWVPLVIAICCTLSSLTVQPTFAQAAKENAGGYFVEFRVAEIGAYGHSYVAYGTGSRVKYADLHPMGNYAIMALGHVLPVPANTEWDAGVLALPISSRFRVSLTAQQYARLVAAVARAKANKTPYWNAITNNCNHFIGQLAEAIGLKVPASFQVSYSFVPALKSLNAGVERVPASKGASKPSPPPS